MDPRIKAAETVVDRMSDAYGEAMGALGDSCAELQLIEIMMRSLALSTIAKETYEFLKERLLKDDESRAAEAEQAAAVIAAAVSKCQKMLKEGE